MISIASQILIVIVAIEHIYILWLEMFAWNTAGKRVFKSLPADIFEKTKVMAANQGLYNGFLSAGLLWSIFIQDAIWSKNVALFFLGTVTIAGIYGAFTAQRSIFYVQALPAIIAILFTLLR